MFGGRSFSLYEVTNSGLSLVFDSCSEFEQVTAEKLPDYFNASNDKTSLDNRSGKKGPEPESVITGKVNGKTYAFVAIERIGGIMVYDITDPENSEFVNYINSREFDDVIKGDVSPEGLCFVSASDNRSGKALLLAACEVSGTLAVYECEYKENDFPPADAGVIVHRHNLTMVPAKHPTESEAGHMAYYVCSSCGKWFADAEGKERITDPSDILLPAIPKTNIWVKREEGWYFIGEDSKPVENTWVMAKDIWYYLDETGAMARDRWILHTGGNWYYVDADGKMAVNTLVSGRYWVDASGVWVE